MVCEKVLEFEAGLVEQFSLQVHNPKEQIVASNSTAFIFT